MTTTPELEAMANAITDAFDCENCGYALVNLSECGCSRPSWTRSAPTNQARAALRAIREPTEAMVIAGHAAVRTGAAVHTPEAAQAVAKTIISGAIDHILGETLSGDASGGE